MWKCTFEDIKVASICQKLFAKCTRVVKDFAKSISINLFQLLSFYKFSVKYLTYLLHPIIHLKFVDVRTNALGQQERLSALPNDMIESPLYPFSNKNV